MRRLNLISVLFFVLPIFMAGCGDGGEDSPFSNIYGLPELKNISDSIRQFPKRDELFYRRANLILDINSNYSDAAAYDLNKAWALNNKPEYATDLGYLLQKKKPDSAIHFLKEAIKLFPADAELNFCLAEAFLQAKQPNKALSVVNAISVSDSANKYFLERKVSLLVRMEEKTEAIEILEKLFNTGNKYVGADLAFLLAETQNPKVLTIANDMIKSDSAQERAEPYYFKGIYYYNTGNKQKAIELFNRAILNDKFFTDAWIEKGKTQFELNQLAASKTTFDKIIEISPDNADAFYWLGKCEEATGNKEEAKLNYQKAYALDKTLTEAKEAAARIN